MLPHTGTYILSCYTRASSRSSNQPTYAGSTNAFSALHALPLRCQSASSPAVLFLYSLLLASANAFLAAACSVRLVSDPFLPHLRLSFFSAISALRACSPLIHSSIQKRCLGDSPRNSRECVYTLTYHRALGVKGLGQANMGTVMPSTNATFDDDMDASCPLRRSTIVATHLYYQSPATSTNQHVPVCL
jgi:hypothetical protein